MFHEIRSYEWLKTTLLVVSIALLGVVNFDNSFAGEIPAAAAPAALSQAQLPSETASAKTDDAAGKSKLVSMEAVYAGMFEAERQRIKMARADTSVDNEALIKQWGVQVISVSYAADGFWLDFRFRVIDPEKAGVLFDNRYKPYLQAEASGEKFAVPTAAKVGALRTTNRGHNVQAGKIYTIMFANPGFHVKPGQQVTVAAGDFKVEHLVVRGSSQNLTVKR